MPIPSLRTGCLALSLPILLAYTPLHGQGTGSWSGCKTDQLANYNCASYYSGTVSLTSTLKTPSGTETRSIIATVTAGRVVCRVKNAAGSEFEGAGLLAAEHASTGAAGKYTVRVWCPEAKDQAVGRDDSPVIDSYAQQASDYATLAGKDTHDHPETDAANGVTGTETVAWQLHW